MTTVHQQQCTAIYSSHNKSGAFDVQTY